MASGAEAVGSNPALPAYKYRPQRDLQLQGRFAGPGFTNPYISLLVEKNLSLSSSPRSNTKEGEKGPI